MYELPRMRTIGAAIAQLRQDDPNTCFTHYALRRMILEGRVKYIRSGTKYLVDYGHLLTVLRGEVPAPANKHDPMYGDKHIDEERRKCQ